MRNELRSSGAGQGSREPSTGSRDSNGIITRVQWGYKMGAKFAMSSKSSVLGKITRIVVTNAVRDVASIGLAVGANVAALTASIMRQYLIVPFVSVTRPLRRSETKSMQGSMLLASAAAVLLWPQIVSAQVTDSAPVTPELVLQIPKVDYRKDWVEIGSVSNLAEKSDEGSKQIDTVYVERKNLERYLKDGKFPDGTMLVKELLATKTEQLTTGTISYATGEVRGRFVMVKDSEGKLGSGPRFGDGWGWAFYKGNQTTKTVTGDFKVDCVGCHQAAKGDDMLHVRLYPLFQR